MVQDQAKNIFLFKIKKKKRPDIDETCLYVKDPFDSKYQLLINRRGKVGMKKLKNLKAFFTNY